MELGDDVCEIMWTVTHDGPPLWIRYNSDGSVTMSRAELPLADGAVTYYPHADVVVRWANA